MVFASLFDVSYNESPTVAANNRFGWITPWKTVTWAQVTYDQSLNSTLDTSGGIDISVNWGLDASGANTVQVFPFVRKTQSGVTTRVAATTIDLNGKKFTCISTGN